MEKRISITFTDEQVEVIEKIARRSGDSFADTVRKLCDEATKISGLFNSLSSMNIKMP
ncbi:MAG: hypothetical protein RSD13_06270 [Clostridium sp.]